MCARDRATTLYPVDAWGLNHDAVLRIGGEAPRWLFRWAIQRGYIEQDPTAGIERPAKEQSRDRVLTDGELAVVWHAAVRLGYPFGSFVRLLMLLGQRRSEVAEMRWSELDLDKMLWTLPRERTKNDRPHHVPLSEPVAEILQEMPKLDNRVY